MGYLGLRKPKEQGLPAMASNQTNTYRVVDANTLKD
jgi:hypothetical protein